MNPADIKAMLKIKTGVDLLNDRIDHLLAEIERLKEEKQSLALDYLAEQGQWIEETGKLRTEIERLLSNAKQDAEYLAAYHRWCQMNGCAPSSSDLIAARAALKENEDDR